MNAGDAVIEISKVDETAVEREKIQHLIANLEPHRGIDIDSDDAIAWNNERR